MKKLFLGILFLMISTIIFSQNVKIWSPDVESFKSSTRKFLDSAKFTRINRDWKTIAKISSGWGENVKIFPIEVINLKTGDKTRALQIDLYSKEELFTEETNKKHYKTAWVGFDEIDEFIIFIEKYIIPNLNKGYLKRSAEFIFKSKEITLSYLINEKRRLSIKLNEFNDEFWTQTQVKEITKLLEVLKIVKTIDY